MSVSAEKPCNSFRLWVDELEKYGHRICGNCGWAESEHKIADAKKEPTADE